MSISNEAVEAAYQALPYSAFPHLTEEDLRLSIEAAAPHIVAAALRDAAAAWGEAASWSDSRPSHEQVQRWLRSRANSYERPAP